MTSSEPTRWARPVPVIGDATSAAQRSDRPDGWAFDDATVAALDRVVGARRDIRRYRPDPVPADLVTAVLAAGHAGPSVGHSQPWRFIVVTDQAVRDRAALLADRERLRQASALTPERAARLLDLQLDGIREAPLGVVVACDRRAPATGVLGRATFPDADLWSCACAIENMWLTARAHGLGMGWVTLFPPAELADLLHLPDGVVSLGWLCLGWPDERPPAPGLERRAWSTRMPLADVVLHDRWPALDAPAAPVSFLRAPEQADVVAAHDGADELLTPPGSLGVLDTALDRVVAAGGAALTAGTLVLAGADHPVATLGVTAYPPGVTREVMRAAVAGQALGVTTAAACGLASLVIDAGVDGGLVPAAIDARVDGPRGDLLATDAMIPGTTEAYLQHGRRIGAAAAEQGLVALGEVGVGNTTVAAALAAGLLGWPAADAVGIGAGSDSAMVRRKSEVVDAALRRFRASNGSPPDPIAALAALGGPEIAVLTGVVLGAAGAGAVVVLDGLATGVAALVAVRLEPAVQAYLIAGQVSREQAHRAVLTELGLEPLLDLRLRAGEGVGAALAAQLVLSGLRVRREAGRVAPAGQP